jgi:hypothetical protein
MVASKNKEIIVETGSPTQWVKPDLALAKKAIEISVSTSGPDSMVVAVFEMRDKLDMAINTQTSLLINTIQVVAGNLPKDAAIPISMVYADNKDAGDYFFVSSPKNGDLLKRVIGASVGITNEKIKSLGGTKLIPELPTSET